MRYAPSEKLEIIRTVEQSSLGVKRTLAQIGIPRATFYSYSSFVTLNLKAFAITLTELNAMAAAAMTGLSKTPKTG